MLQHDDIRMALVGYEAERQKIDAKIAELNQRLDGHGTRTTTSAPSTNRRRKRVMSAAAKERIRQAQRKRWAAFHKEHGKAPVKAAATPAKPKRKLSPAAKAKLVANLKKARAAKAAKAKAAAA